jgi:hypothetical protein
MRRVLCRFRIFMVALALPLAGCWEPAVHDFSANTSYQSNFCALGKYTGDGHCAIAPVAK